MVNWAARELPEFLAAISSSPDERSAIVGALEWTAEALDAEVIAIVRSGRVIAALGYPARRVPNARLIAVAAAGAGRVPVPPADEQEALVVRLDGALQGGHLLLARGDGRSFSREEVNLVRALARVLTLTLRMLRLLQEAHEKDVENHRLIVALSERQDLLERLSRIQRSISHRATVDEVLDAIVSGARELLGDNAAMVRLLDPDDPSCLAVRSWSGMPVDRLGLSERSGLYEGSWGGAVREDAVAIEAWAAVSGGPPRSSMSVPVHDAGRVVGALTVVSLDPDRTYLDPEREALQAFAEHVRLAMTNASTIEAEARERHSALEFDLARKILADLCPGPPVGHPGLDVHAETRAAYTVGGDFFDFEVGGGDELVCVLGDVAGKGIPAALLVAMTRASIRAAARAAHEDGPSAMLARANSELYQDYSRLGLFATIFLACYDPATRRLVTANAGHSPVIYRPAGGRARLVRAKAPPIGVVTDWRTSSSVLRMAEGDLLIAATDGFSESAGVRTGELFGNSRLLRLADRTASHGAAEIAAAFFEVTDEFRGGDGADDDRTLIVIRGAPAG